MPMRGFQVAALSGALFLAASPYQPAFAQRADLGWRPYIDNSTGTRVDFPAALFPVKAGAPQQGIGQIFQSEDGRAKFSAYTLPNKEGHTPRSYLQTFLKVNRSTIDYHRVSNRFFVVSGVRNGEVYYSRCNFYRQMHCIYISYPQRELRAWDRIVTRVSHSLRGPG